MNREYCESFFTRAEKLAQSNGSGPATRFPARCRGRPPERSALLQASAPSPLAAAADGRPAWEVSPIRQDVSQGLARRGTVVAGVSAVAVHGGTSPRGTSVAVERSGERVGTVGDGGDGENAVDAEAAAERVHSAAPGSAMPYTACGAGCPRGNDSGPTKNAGTLRWALTCGKATCLERLSGTPSGNTFWNDARRVDENGDLRAELTWRRQRQSACGESRSASPPEAPYSCRRRPGSQRSVGVPWCRRQVRSMCMVACWSES